MDMSTAENCKTIAATYLLVYNVGGMIVSPFMGIIADMAGGNYGPSYLMLAVLTVIGYICTATAYKIAAENRKALDASKPK